MSACSQFNGHIWKPDLCRDCLKPRSAHETRPQPLKLRSRTPQVVAVSVQSSDPVEYANIMPKKGSKKEKRSPSLSKKFNALISRDKAPVPLPRKVAVNIDDISGPYPTSMDPDSRVKSDSTFESVSSVDDLEVRVFDQGVNHYEDPGDIIENSDVFLDRVDPHNGRPSSLLGEIQEHLNCQPDRSNGFYPEASGDIVDDSYASLDVISPLEVAAENSLKGKEEPGANTSKPPKPPKPQKPPLKTKPKVPISSIKKAKQPPLPAPYKNKVASEVENETVSPVPKERKLENQSSATTDDIIVKSSTAEIETSSSHDPVLRKRSKTFSGSDSSHRRRPPPPPPVSAKPTVSSASLGRSSPLDKLPVSLHVESPPKPPRQSSSTPATPAEPPEPPSLSTKPQALTPTVDVTGHSYALVELSPEVEIELSESLEETDSSAITSEKKKEKTKESSSSLSNFVRNKLGRSSKAERKEKAKIKEKEKEKEKEKNKEKKKDKEKDVKESAEKPDEETEEKKTKGSFFHRRSKTFSSGQKKVKQEDRSVDISSPVPFTTPPPKPPRRSPSPATSTNSHPEVRSRATTSSFINRPLPSISDSVTVSSHDYAECGETIVSKKVPPPDKPESNSIKSVQRPSTSSGSNADRMSIASDCLPSLQNPETVPTDPLIVTIGQLQSMMGDVISDSTKKISGLYKRLYTPTSSLKCTWKDCKPVSDWPAVEIEENTYAVQIMSLEQTIIEDEIIAAVPPHPHIVRKLAAFEEPPPFPLPGLPKPKGKHLYVLTSASSNLTVKEFLKNYRSEVSPERFERMICFILLQLFLALHHLYRHGVVHRDLSPDVLFINPNNHHVQLGDFSYALCKKNSNFVYSFKELKWLGGSDARLPPEIVDTPDKAQELNYSHTDVFAAGCIIYEMMGQANPFESEPDLIHSYTLADLPPMPPFTSYSTYLEKVTHMLLKRDTSERTSAATALQIMSCLLWLPHSWIKQPTRESLMQNYLLYEKTRLVADIAETTTKGFSVLPLEGLLKSSFFTLVSSGQILKTLETYAGELSS